VNQTTAHAGQAGTPGDDLRRFADCWNGERFFDAHETLEPRWIATRDRGLRGLIQLAAAFHHLQRGNLAGAKTTLERAISGLSDPRNGACALDQKELARYAAAILPTLGTTPTDEIIAQRPRLAVEDGDGSRR
jgi:predicted metal-dependent hydrolase